VPLGGLVRAVLLAALGLVGIGQLPVAVFLGAANVAVGVIAHRLLVWLVVTPARRWHSAS
jgi:hypothetical protein